MRRNEFWCDADDAPQPSAHGRGRGNFFTVHRPEQVARTRTERALHALRDIGPLIESGSFALPVAQTFPLERIGEAHALSQDGHVRGKLVLLVG